MGDNDPGRPATNRPKQDPPLVEFDRIGFARRYDFMVDQPAPGIEEQHDQALVRAKADQRSEETRGIVLGPDQPPAAHFIRQRMDHDAARPGDRRRRLPSRILGDDRRLGAQQFGQGRKAAAQPGGGAGRIANPRRG